jgi:hypothetical protein
MRAIMRAAAAIVFLLSSVARAEPPAITLYDNDPVHLWDRLHAALRVRETANDGLVGVDSVDPILWSNTKHLLAGESHRSAVAALDEFIANHGERLIDDPVKRAILQHDLWAVFDWTCGSDGREAGDFEGQRKALQLRLASVLRRVALTRAQINALPNTYAAAVESRRFATEPDAAHPQTPFLPPDLLDPTGPWLNLYRPGDGIAAPLHVRSFGARSTFNTFLRHPGGREAGIAYLKQLSEFPDPYVASKDEHGRQQMNLNPKLPQFPAGTQVALLRRAILIDADGNLAPTNLVETVQLRVYLTDPATATGKREDQSFHEFNFTRRDLFSNPGGALRAVEADEQDILNVQFAGHGIDWIEAPLNRPGETRRLRYPVMNACFSCHGGAGIFSVNTFTRMFGPQTFSPTIGQSGPEMQFTLIEAAKRERFDFGLLQGLMRDRDRGD